MTSPEAAEGYESSIVLEGAPRRASVGSSWPRNSSSFAEPARQ
ncbi:hypothetical protein [Streptomyces sp. NPDC007856]